MLEHLPPSNPVARELNERTGSDYWLSILRDIANTHRVELALLQNVHKRKGAEDVTPDLHPDPWERTTEQDTVAPEVIQAERDHLQAVLNRRIPQ